MWCALTPPEGSGWGWVDANRKWRIVPWCGTVGAVALWWNTIREGNANFLTRDAVASWLVGSFISWQHLRSYQDGYRLMTMHMHGIFMVLPHWETRLSAALCWHWANWANQSSPYHNNAEGLARKWHVSIFNSLVWLDQGSVWIPRSPKPRDG